MAPQIKTKELVQQNKNVVEIKSAILTQVQFISCLNTSKDKIEASEIIKLELDESKSRLIITNKKTGKQNVIFTSVIGVIEY
jgi:hypothetical protein